MQKKFKFQTNFLFTKYIENISENIVHRKYMHAILVGKKIYALDMPSNLIFTHQRWLVERVGVSRMRFVSSKFSKKENFQKKNTEKLYLLFNLLSLDLTKNIKCSI